MGVGPDLSVRDARPADRPALVRFMAALQERERALHPNRMPGDVAADPHFAYLEGLVAERQGRILVAEQDGALIGMLVCFTEDDGGHYIVESERTVGWISDLFVLPEARGRGVARAMTDAAENHFRTIGVNTLMLAYLAGNAEAEAAYRRMGFTDYEHILSRPVRR